MKRELKGLCYVSDLLWSNRNRDIPDEEGTESATIGKGDPPFSFHHL